VSDDAVMQLERRTQNEVFGDDVRIAAWHYALAEPVPPHVHDFIECALVTSGAARYATAEGTSRLGPGDVVVVRPGAWHAYTPDEGAETFEVTNAYLGPETVHRELAWVLDYPRLARLLLVGGQLEAPLPRASCRRVAGWLGQLAEEQRHPDRLLNAGLLQCVLVEMSRATEQQVPLAAPALSGPVRRVLQCMSDDLARPWTVAELASRGQLSASALYRQFHDQLGSGPVERLTRMRAEVAATMLVQTDLPVAAIGRLVGWPDPSYASRRFCRVFEVSPTAYRRAHAATRRADPAVHETIQASRRRRDPRGASAA
jgi:AraC family L-rhamnose operon transcriptional activator RhaR